MFHIRLIVGAKKNQIPCGYYTNTAHRMVSNVRRDVYFFAVGWPKCTVEKYTNKHLRFASSLIMSYYYYYCSYFLLALYSHICDMQRFVQFVSTNKAGKPPERRQKIQRIVYVTRTRIVAQTEAKSRTNSYTAKYVTRTELWISILAASPRVWNCFIACALSVVPICWFCGRLVWQKMRFTL